MSESRERKLQILDYSFGIFIRWSYLCRPNAKMGSVAQLNTDQKV